MGDEVPEYEEVITFEGDGGGAGDIAPGVKLSNLTLWQETTLAIQQFSIVAGVVLMWISLWLLMIGIDIALEWIEEKVSRLLGRRTFDDPEDPAALVGSFKRYKN